MARGIRGRGFGPGWLVAAAFIGPGTVTTATRAGAGFGTALIWALLFSTVATLILQEMAARLGLVTGSGLGEAIRRRFSSPVLRVGSIVLVISAITIGNAAYQTGNLLGGGLGLSGSVGFGSAGVWGAVLGILAFGLLWTGSYALVERVMVILVFLMSIAFLCTAAVVIPSVDGLFSGLFAPSVPDGSILVVVGLIGTTVVPYNLFLHASAVGEKWSGAESLGTARRDLFGSIALGGAISMAILLTSAGTIFGTGVEVENAGQMATQLEPLLGGWATLVFSVGLLAAGTTSAITAPLAAAYATAGALGWERDLRSPRLRWVWGAVLVVGVALSLTGIRPVEAIVFAQVANGLLLPAIAIFLLLAVNDERWMGSHRNRLLSNVAGGIVVLVSIGLGVRAIGGVLGFW